VTDVTSCRQAATVDRFSDPEAFCEYFKTRYGPTMAVYDRIADDADRVAALDRDLAALARAHDRGQETTVMDWEYLLLTAVRREGGAAHDRS
jgi:hypothetical protein